MRERKGREEIKKKKGETGRNWGEIAKIGGNKKKSIENTGKMWKIGKWREK